MSNTKGNGPSQSALILLFLSALASAGLYGLTNGSPLCLAPLILYIANFALRVVARRKSPDQDILLGFLVLSLLVDDISQVAWGRTIDTWTEALGAILFKSYGLTGMETFAILLSAWLVLRRAPLLFRDWNKLGFFPIFLVGVAVFICSYIAGISGVMSGGQVNTMFIQLRFLHCLPLWVFIGFAIWRDRTFTEKALKWMTIAICFKSLQALFVYFTNYSLFKYDEEYLIDHYFSGFSVVAIVCLVYYFFKEKSLALKATIAGSIVVVAMAYIFNDRRTSYVGVALALATLPLVLPLKFLKKYLPHGIGLAIAGALFTMITWNMPMPLGFIGETYRSFGNETGTGEPSYRDLENANLINAVTQSPVAGIGYGKEFDEVFPMPDISYVYERYRMIPHNLFLASWAFGGPLTISALSLLFATMIAFSGRLLKVSKEPILFLFGIVSLFYFLQYLTYTFGDLGFQIQRNQMLAGLLLGASFRIGSEISLAEKRGEKWV